MILIIGQMQESDTHSSSHQDSKECLFPSFLHWQQEEVCQLMNAVICFTAVGLCAEEYVERQIDGTLSGGEMKRIEIASVLAKDHELCIFDERKAGIDFVELFNVNTEIRRDA